MVPFETQRPQTGRLTHQRHLKQEKNPAGTLINKDKHTHTHSCTCPHTAHAQTDSFPLQNLLVFVVSDSPSLEVIHRRAKGKYRNLSQKLDTKPSGATDEVQHTQTLKAVQESYFIHRERPAKAYRLSMIF